MQKAKRECWALRIFLLSQIAWSLIVITNQQQSHHLLVPQKIAINDATIEEIWAIPEIGVVKARKIYRWRRRKKLQKVEDLQNIAGIGKKFTARIARFIKIEK